VLWVGTSDQPRTTVDVQDGRFCEAVSRLTVGRSQGPGGFKIHEMQQPEFWLLPQSRREIRSSFEFMGGCAIDNERGVRVRVAVDRGGEHKIDETRMRQTFAFAYERAGLSVSFHYFVSLIKQRHLLNGAAQERFDPVYFAIPMDSTYKVYSDAVAHCCGTASTQSEFNEFIADLVDALRLYSRRWLDTAIPHAGKKVEERGRIFGFNTFDAVDERGVRTVASINERAAQVLARIETGSC
jgi:hypothetical protein